VTGAVVWIAYGDQPNCAVGAWLAAPTNSGADTVAVWPPANVTVSFTVFEPSLENVCAGFFWVLSVVPSPLKSQA
jgi:hypothetical protein